MSLIETVSILVLCHLIGDYVLQCDFIAKTKGDNVYHLFVHCALYVVPFIVCFGMDYRIAILFATHFPIDIAKARYKKISYTLDQILHYAVIVITYMFVL